MNTLDIYKVWNKYAYIPSEMGLNGMFKQIYGQQVTPKIEDYYSWLIETEDRLYE